MNIIFSSFLTAPDFEKCRILSGGHCQASVIPSKARTTAARVPYRNPEAELWKREHMCREKTQALLSLPKPTIRRPARGIHERRPYAGQFIERCPVACGGNAATAPCSGVQVAGYPQTGHKNREKCRILSSGGESPAKIEPSRTEARFARRLDSGLGSPPQPLFKDFKDQRHQTRRRPPAFEAAPSGRS